MWSPKTKKNGARNPFYDTMTQVENGDIVFSFKDQTIPAIGIIQSSHYEATKPQEFGSAGANWTRIGWKVDVQYVDPKSIINPKRHIKELVPVFPEKYSPLTADGNGKQAVYLAAVPHEMADVLLRLIGMNEAAIFANSRTIADRDEESREREEATVIKQIESDQQIGETEKQAIIKARRDQGLFKARLFKVEKRCRLTHVTNPNHLIASHIKPWAKCENNESRLDGNNGLLLAPQMDHLFDKGYISFEDDGTLLISSFSDLSSLQLLGIIVDQPVNVGQFNEQQQYYLLYHRENVFKK